MVGCVPIKLYTKKQTMNQIRWPKPPYYWNKWIAGLKRMLNNDNRMELKNTSSPQNEEKSEILEINVHTGFGFENFWKKKVIVLNLPGLLIHFFLFYFTNYFLKKVFCCHHSILNYSHILPLKYFKFFLFQVFFFPLWWISPCERHKWPSYCKTQMPFLCSY